MATGLQEQKDVNVCIVVKTIQNKRIFYNTGIKGF